LTVKIWFVYESAEPSRRGAKYALPTQRDIKYTLPLEICMRKMGLSEDQWISAMEHAPRPRDQSHQAGGLAPPRHVLCEIDESEAQASGWKTGYYRVDLSPGEVAKRLGPPLAI
jgi:hypothetical protein